MTVRKKESKCLGCLHKDGNVITTSGQTGVSVGAVGA